MMYLFGKSDMSRLPVRPLTIHAGHFTAPIAYPIAKLLDWILGANDTHTYKKAELK